MEREWEDFFFNLLNEACFYPPALYADEGQAQKRKRTSARRGECLQLSQFASLPPLPNRNNVNLMIWIHGHALFPVWSNKMLLYMPINVSKIRFHWNQGTSYPTFLLHLWKLQRLPSLPYAAKEGFLPHSSPVFGRLRMWSSAAVIRALRFQAVATCVLLLSFPFSYHCPNTHDTRCVQKFSMKFGVYCFWSVGSY